jgi:arginine N-succinyltransferase
VHREGEAALAMLSKEGFRSTGLVDIFDAGPTVACPRDEIRTVRDSVRARVRVGEPTAAPGLVSTDTVEGFRAIATPVAIIEGEAVLPAEAAEALRVTDGDPVRVRTAAA